MFGLGALGSLLAQLLAMPGSIVRTERAGSRGVRHSSGQATSLAGAIL